MVGVYSGRPHASSTDCQKTGSAHPQPNAVGVQGTDSKITWYRHASPGANIKKGLPVGAGTVLGTADISGCSSGAHPY